MFGFAYEKSEAALLLAKCTKDARKMRRGPPSVDGRLLMNVYGKAMDESKRAAHGKVVRLVLPRETRKTSIRQKPLGCTSICGIGECRASGRLRLGFAILEAWRKRRRSDSGRKRVGDEEPLKMLVVLK